MQILKELFQWRVKSGPSTPLGTGEWRATKHKRRHTLRCTGKSAEVIDGKGVAWAPLRKRVRIALEAKEIKEVEEAEERIGGS